MTSLSVWHSVSESVRLTLCHPLCLSIELCNQLASQWRRIPELALQLSSDPRSMIMMSAIMVLANRVLKTDKNRASYSLRSPINNSHDSQHYSLQPNQFAD